MASERQIVVGGIPIGGGAPVSVQSMTTTKTHDVAATLEQVGRLREAGADIVRVAVPGIPDADALPAIVAGAGLPIIADIHFNASLALRAMDTGVAAVRINPGNIGGADKVEAVVRKAQATATPLRIGANSGSLPDHLRPHGDGRSGRSARGRRDGGGRAARAARFPRLQDLGQVVQRADDDRGLPPAGRRGARTRCTWA